jgi:L-rhamnose mutarotase
MPTQATYDDANLILRLYELRREEKLRRAREWFSANFHAASPEDVQRIAPPGSDENAYFRMVVSYWEMVAALVTAGVLNQDLFFQTNGELLFVWERVRELVPAFRAMMKNPNAWRNLETVGNAFIKSMEASDPETYPTFQAMVRGAGAGR